MRRGTTVVRDRDQEGSERSQQLALTLAGIACPELMEQLVYAVSKAHSIGGQFFLAAGRSKYGKRTVRNNQGEILGETWELLEDPREAGDYETDYYVLHWDHIATAIRGAEREDDTQFPVDVARERKSQEVTLPVNGDGELRDEIEAEVAEAMARERDGSQFEPAADEEEAR